MRPKVSTRQWGGVLFALVVLAQLWVLFVPTSSLLNWFTTDDAFYYFKVAQNIAEGHGSTFDGMHLSNGYHPLWMLICVPVFALARFDLILPLRLIVLISILLSAGTSVIIFRLLKRWVREPIAWLVGLSWALLPAIARNATLKGMEAGVNVFFVALLVERVASLREERDEKRKPRHIFAIGLIAALAVMSRLDNIFVLLAIGLWLIFDRLSLGHFWLGYLTAAVVSVLVSFFLRLGFVNTYPQFLPGVYAMLGLAAAFKPVAAILLGMSSRGGRLPVLRLLAAVGLGSAITGGGMMVLNVLGVIESFPRSVILYDAVLTLVLFGVVWFAGSRFIKQPTAVKFGTEFRGEFAVWFRRGLAYSLPVVLILGGYMAWSYFTFGTASPVSGQVKHWWGTLPDTVYGDPIQSFGGLFGFPETLNGAWQMLFSPLPLKVQGWIWPMVLWVFLLVAGWIAGGRKHGMGIWPMAAACLLQVLYYHGSYYVGIRPWYWLNEALLAVLVWAVALDGGWNWLTRRWRHFKALPIAVGVCSLALVVNFIVWMGSNFPMTRAAGDVNIYLTETAWLEKLTPPGSVIGMSGSGSVGYFIRDRQVVNLDGLINSYDYYEALKAGKGREAVDAFGLDYVYGQGYLLTSSNPYYDILDDRLARLTTSGEQVLFRYVKP